MTNKMSNEEAVIWLNTDDYASAGYGEALAMAINLLESQPCEDCIPRDKVLNMLADINTEMSDGEFFFEHWYSYIEKMPSVTSSYSSIKTELKPYEDCVSREELDDAISELTFWHPTTDGRLEVGAAFNKTVYKVEDVWRLTKVLPSVQPQPKKGNSDEVLASCADEVGIAWLEPRRVKNDECK